MASASEVIHFSGYIKVLNETKDAFDFQLDALAFGGLVLG